jgi:hypothetical protein
MATEKNIEFSKSNQAFLSACKAVILRSFYNADGKLSYETLPPTKRQASKFRNGKGRAWIEGMKTLRERANCEKQGVVGE